MEQNRTPGAPSERARRLREQIFGHLLTLGEAAYVLGLDKATVARYLRRGRIPDCLKIGGEWRIPEEGLIAFHREIAGAAKDRQSVMRAEPVAGQDNGHGRRSAHIE